MAPVSSSGLRPAAEPSSTFVDGNGRHQREQVVGVDAGGRGPFPNGDQLDGAGDDSAQLLVGAARPLEPVGVDDEHVDVVRRGRPPPRRPTSS